MSKSPLGPYEYKGVIINNAGCDPETWNNHPKSSETLTIISQKISDFSTILSLRHNCDEDSSLYVTEIRHIL